MKPKSPTPAGKPEAAPDSARSISATTGKPRTAAGSNFDGERTPLPRDLAPGETLRHFLTIKAPPQPGPARLHLTLVQEGVGWFDQQGCPALILPASIE